jgi:hypothetical protein
MSETDEKFRETVDRYHKIYIESLKELYDKYKDVYHIDRKSDLKFL